METVNRKNGVFDLTLSYLTLSSLVLAHPPLSAYPMLTTILSFFASLLSIFIMLLIFHMLLEGADKWAICTCKNINQLQNTLCLYDVVIWFVPLLSFKTFYSWTCHLKKKTWHCFTFHALVMMTGTLLFLLAKKCILIPYDIMEVMACHPRCNSLLFSVFI